MDLPVRGLDKAILIGSGVGGQRTQQADVTASSPTEGPPQRAFVPGPPTDPSFDAIVISFRCVSSGSHMFVFSSHTRPATARHQPQRSPPRLFTDAACGGLQSPPPRRPRRTHLHHWHSTDRADDLLHHHHHFPSGHTWVPKMRSWALTRGYALHPGTSCVASFTGSSRCWHGWLCAWDARRTLRSSCCATRSQSCTDRTTGLPSPARTGPCSAPSRRATASDRNGPAATPKRIARLSCTPSDLCKRCGGATCRRPTAPNPFRYFRNPFHGPNPYPQKSLQFQRSSTYAPAPRGPGLRALLRELDRGSRIVTFGGQL